MKKNLLLSPEGADGGTETGTGNAGAGTSTGEELFTGTEGDQGDNKGAGEGGTEEADTGASTTGLSKEDITAILQEAIGSQQQQQVQGQQQQQQQPPTAEELEKLFNVWKPDAQLIAQLRAEKPEDAIKALTAIRDGLLRQAMTMAEYRVQQLLKNLQDEQLAPLNDYVSEAQATSFRNDFFQKFPDLEPYEQIVDAVAAKLQQGGYSGDSRDAVMQKFADETKAIVQQLTGGKGATGGTTQNGAQPNAGQRRMSTLSTGGGQGHGGGRAGAGQAKGPPGIEVFD